MKKSIQLLAAGLFFITTIASAQWSSNDKIKGNGNVISENRTTTAYDEIKVSGSFNVDLVSGTEGNITVKGEENLLAYIKIEVENNVLKIYTEKNKTIITSNGKEIQITVPFEKIEALSLSGSGNVITKTTLKSNDFTARLSGSGTLSLDVDVTNLNLEMSGSGNLVLNGDAEIFTGQLSGSGNANTTQLKAKNADLTVSGSGNMKVFCSEALKAKVSGSGTIKYSGNPKTNDTKVSGSGKISKV